MADNISPNVTSGGPSLRFYLDTNTVDHAGCVTEYVSGGSAGAWTVQQVDATHGLPVTVPFNPQLAPVTLFDQTTNQAGATQSALFFPTTIAITGGVLPTVGSGSSATLTNAGNVCGGVFSPAPGWGSVLLDLIGVGGASTNTLTIEIGRLGASGAVPQVLASVVLTASTTTLGATTINPLTGGTGHSSVTWRFFDAVAITSKSQLGDVLQAVGGTSGGGPQQLVLNVGDSSYYYIVITALNGGWTEVLCAIQGKA